MYGKKDGAARQEEKRKPKESIFMDVVRGYVSGWCDTGTKQRAGKGRIRTRLVLCLCNV